MQAGDHVKLQIGNASRDMESFCKNRKEMLEVENKGTEMKTGFYQVICKPDMTKKKAL